MESPASPGGLAGDPLLRGGPACPHRRPSPARSGGPRAPILGQGPEMTPTSASLAKRWAKPSRSTFHPASADSKGHEGPRSRQPQCSGPKHGVGQERKPALSVRHAAARHSTALGHLPTTGTMVGGVRRSLLSPWVNPGPGTCTGLTECFLKHAIAGVNATGPLSAAASKGLWQRDCAIPNVQHHSPVGGDRRVL